MRADSDPKLVELLNEYAEEYKKGSAIGKMVTFGKIEDYIEEIERKAYNDGYCYVPGDGA